MGWITAQRWGLEWFYRVLQEPGRVCKRYLVTNSQFGWLLLKARLGGGNAMLSLEAKKAYFARTRRANYIASLRLEGFAVDRKESAQPLSAKTELVTRYRRERG